ncbi:UNVERIFIED_CONTAM: hypothetical protein Sindi_0293200 [Sesamum indicum]
MSIKILEGDEAIRELFRDYKGCNVISIYIEENTGPLLSIDASGNILNYEEHVPILQYGVEDAGDEEGIKAENESFGVENEGVGVENEGVEAEAGNVENEGAGVEAGNVVEEAKAVEGEEVGDETRVEIGVNAKVQTRVEGEDLEGPYNDDIFISRTENYTRIMLKTLRGSDDEGDRCPMWDEMTNMGEVDLVVGMEFETRAKFRIVMSVWAMRRGWDLKLVKNEKYLILATCKNECNWKLSTSSS